MAWLHRRSAGSEEVPEHTGTASEAAPGAAIAEPARRHRLQRGQRGRHAAQHHRPRAARTPAAQAHPGVFSYRVPTATTRSAAATREESRCQV